MNETLDEEYLSIRAKLLEVAASLDRIGRGSGTTPADARLAQFSEAVSVLQTGFSGELPTGQSPEGRMAERLQLIFSLPYKKDWQSDFGLG